ncbi:IS3 family transposase [Clostridium paraputrificum]|uniref:IS3 family transposase n=1 Tax=Clostridium TaxID=1485 RepID=UPI001898811E|nr:MULTISPECIES: IS3 family transposase [Clostridium]MDB2091149.1 IS3 family transposase [Clostridium paraputrificum]MDB2097905.1 IS3 family transposase [Clostridium paraputrificum]MDB2124886.1 IS3 family transposase [Clostridium paraputrificum]MDU1181362.1 IS3 family transposase [Clostridium sp.]
MSKKIFSDKDIEILSNNKYVLNVSKKAITYTNEFKIHFIAEYNKGKSSRTIFEEAGFDSNMIGFKRIDCSSSRWRKAYKENGVLGLDDTRRNSSGRPRKRELTKDEIIVKQNAEIEYLRAEVELLKKLELQERQVRKGKVTAAEAFSLIESITTNSKFYSVIKHLCDVAGVSRSGYYRFLKTKDLRKQRLSEDILAMDIILKAFDHRGYKKGSRSIKMTLESEFGITYSRKRIQRIMRKFNIVCPIRKANPYKRMAKATKEHKVVPNLLNREFKQEVVGKVLLTDITYLPYGKGQMAYLSTIKDASTNEILAYNLSDSLKLDIATDTIHKLMANTNVKLSEDAFIHSDQGVHYTSPIFQKLLKSNKLGQSMSRRGNCWDNAPQESFFGHMKDEIDYKNCTTLAELQSVIDDYIYYYNNYRCQWNLKRLTPAQYRNQLLVA